MQRRIERIQSEGAREGLDFRILSKDKDAPSDFISLAEDQITAHIIQEIRESSITPTTFVSREFQNSFDDQWYIEQYAYKTNNVVRFGINHLSDQVFSSLSSESVPLFDVTVRPASTAKSSSKYTKADATQIPLSQLETLLLNKACNYLLDAGEDTRAVLVDIFVRVNGGASNGCVKLEGMIPEIHTVVLYKNPTVTPLEGTEGKGIASLSSTQRAFTVIDPSNFIFSSHLSNYNNLSTAGHEGEVSFTINTIHKAIQIYQPVTKDIGPAPSQSRDCTDLAVKIALGLNQTNTTLQLLTYEDIKACQIIQNLSNNPVIDSSIITATNPLKIKQTSDIKMLEAFNIAEHLITRTHVCIKKIFSQGDYTEAVNKAVQILDTSISDVDKVESLLNINAEYIDSVHAFLLEQHSSLLGEHNSVKEYIDGVLL